MKAMILAAGLGTRLKPLTDTLPKALVPVAGKPLIEHQLLKLKREGFTEVVVNVHHFADQIIDFLASNQNFGLRIHISDERNLLLETGGGIKRAGQFFTSDEPILVHNVDILSNVSLQELYHRQKADALAMLLVSERRSSRALLFSEQMRLQGWMNLNTNELKTPYDSLCVEQCKCLAFSGIHVVSPSIFAAMQGWAERFSIIDFYLANALEYTIEGTQCDNLQLMDVGKVETLHEAEAFARQLGCGE